MKTAKKRLLKWHTLNVVAANVQDKIGKIANKTSLYDIECGVCLEANHRIKHPKIINNSWFNVQWFAIIIIIIIFALSFYSCMMLIHTIQVIVQWDSCVLFTISSIQINTIINVSSNVLFNSSLDFHILGHYSVSLKCSPGISVCHCNEPQQQAFLFHSQKYQRKNEKIR